MRLGFIFTGTFWGVVLILLGVSAILKSVFNLNIPIFRVGFALLIIYVGVSILFNGFYMEKKENVVLFDNRSVQAGSSEKHDIIFSSSVVDMTGLTIDGYQRQEVNTVFSSGELRINADIPTKIVVSAAFSSASMPDGSSITFGEQTYRNKAYKEGEPYLEIRANVVFGSLNVIEF